MSERKERLGIYGGSFSPIHCGHVNSARLFLEAAELDKLLIMPTHTSPHKDPITEATPLQRFEMAGLAFEDDDAYKSGRLQISDYEISREGRSYTVYTVEHFASPERELFLLVGTDMFLTLDKWFRSEDILRLCDVVLMRREAERETYEKIKEKRKIMEQNFGARIHEIEEPPIIASSTEIRELLTKRADVTGMIPDAVIRYIEKNGLYR